MKKGILLVLGMFLMVSSVEAKNGNESPNRIGVNYAYENAVNFTERGVEFFIFTNGEFDFNTQNHNNYYYYNGRRTRTGHRNISRDFYGRINSVGNVHINYDRYGNVTRIGNVPIRYYRGRLTNVGNLNVRYDRGGYPNFYGHVGNNFYYNNGIRINLNIGTVCDYNDAYFYRSDFSRNYSQIREDNNFYYYRARPNAKIGKRNTILKRRKQTYNRIKNNTVHRKNNISYRKLSSNKYHKKVVVGKRNNTNSGRYSTLTNAKRKIVSNRTNSSTYRKHSPKNTNRKVIVAKRNIKRKVTATSNRKPSTRKAVKKTGKLTKNRRS